jgi:copper(I)-binding protein
MKSVIALSLCLLAFTACKPSETSTTTVTHASDVNGVVTKSSLTLSDAAMRGVLGNNTTTAAYVTIKNNGNTPDRLIGASCACATSTTLHSMLMSGDMMMMQEEKDGFEIKAGETLTFAPGGNHIMLEGLTTRPKAGDKVNIVLNFEKAGAITVSVTVTDTPQAEKAADKKMADMKM